MASDQALELAGRFVRQRLIVKDIDETVQPKGDWQRLKERPCQTIGGNLAIAVDIDSIGDGWVRVGDKIRTIRYRAGMAYTEEALPDPIRKALADIDQHLEGGGDPENLPPVVVALLRPYQRQVAIEAEEAAQLSQMG